MRPSADHVWPLVPVLGAAVLTAALITNGLLIVAAMVLVALVLITIARPNQMLVLWVILVCAIPCWLGTTVPAGGYLQPASLIGIPIAAILLLTRLTNGPLRLRPGDLVVLGYIVLLYVAVKTGGTNHADLKAAILLFGVPYVLGRASGSRAHEKVGRAIAVSAVALAVFGIIELALSFHPFINFHATGPLAYWSPIQVRGGFDRSEATFGHALALGSFLALSVPFVLTYVRRRGLAVVLIPCGVLSTLSRGPVLALAVVALLCVAPGIGLPALARRRGGALVLVAVVAICAYPLAQPVLTQANSELTQSADYRTQILPLTRTMHPLGLASGAKYDPRTKALAFGGGAFGSIDNAPLYLGLTEGGIPAGLLVLGMGGFLITYLRGRAGAGTIAMLGQIPAFLTVALITQWAPLVWFVGGFAVSENARRREERRAAAAAARTERPKTASEYLELAAAGRWDRVH